MNAKNYFENPINKPEDDKLNFSESAKRLANIIAGEKINSSYTVAVTAPWGMGKSSYLNLVKHHLRNLPKQQTKKLLITELDASCYFSVEAFVKDYFSLLISEIEQKSNTKKTGRAKKLVKNLKLYSDTVSSQLDSVPYAGFVSKLWSNIIGLFDSKMNQEDTINKLKEELSKLLEESELKCIIFVDDIDRLPKENIRMIFQLIYAAGKFKNTRFILAYDNKIISNALSGEYGCNGSEYLEKIVQKEIRLTISSPIILQRALLNEICSNIGIEKSVFEEDEDNRNGLEIVYSYLDTLRDIYKICDSFIFAYSALENEVEIIDLLLLKVVMLFDIDLYNFIFKNSSFLIHDLKNKSIYSAFSNAVLGNANEKEIDAKKAEFEKVLDSISNGIQKSPEEREKRIKVLCFLFPTFKSYYDLNDYKVRIKVGNAYRPVSNPYFFNLYFNIEMSSDYISRQTIKKILETFTEDEILANLEPFVENGTIDNVILEIFANDFTQEREKIFAISLIMIYPKFLEFDINSDSPEFFAIRHRGRIISVLKNLGWNLSFELIKKVINSELFENVYHLIAYLLDNRYPNGEFKQESVFSESDLEILENLFVERIYFFIKQGKKINLFDITKETSFFIKLEESIRAENTEKSVLIRWINEQLKEDVNLLIFVYKFVGDNLYYEDRFYKIKNKRFKFITELDRFEKLVDEGNILEKLNNSDEGIKHFYETYCKHRKDIAKTSEGGIL